MAKQTITLGMLVEAMGAPKDVVDWSANLAAWRTLYQCQPKDKVLTFSDGQHTVRQLSLGMPKRVCEDWAGLLWTENAEVTTADKAGSELLHDHLGRSFAPRLVEFLEAEVFARGMGALEVLLDGLPITEAGLVVPDGKATMRVDLVPADCIIPLRWAHGRITDVAFVSYPSPTRATVRRHTDRAGGTTITNTAWQLVGGKLTPAALDDGVAAILDLDGPPLWALVRPAIANNKASVSALETPFGISVLANATSQMETLDLIYDNLARDFRLGRKVVFMQDTLLRHKDDGTPVAPSADMAELYVVLEDATGEGKEGISEHNPSLRVTDNTQALEAALGLVAQAVGMGPERYRYRGETVATATQIVSENSELYRNRRKHFQQLEAALVRIAQALLWCGANLAGVACDTEAEVSVVADDSVIEDDAARISRGLLLVDRVISKRTFLVDYMGMTEDEADAEVARMGAGPAVELF